MFKLDKEKYYLIARTEGLDQALTRLHRDTERWEFDTFEGEKGYQPQSWEALREVRIFSRELWEIGLSGPNAHQQGK